MFCNELKIHLLIRYKHLFNWLEALPAVFISVFLCILCFFVDLCITTVICFIKSAFVKQLEFCWLCHVVIKLQVIDQLFM